jgi:hypothetical protein
MVSKTAVNVAFWGLIFLVISLCVYIYIFTQSEARQCLANPFIYGADKIGGASCSCFVGNTFCGAKFYFDNETFETPVTNCGNPFGNSSSDYSKYINYSSLFTKE